MVAKMEGYAAACLPEDGEGDIPTLEKKDKPIESDSSSSETTGTSTEESSEEEEEEAEEEDGDTGCAQKDGGDEENEEAEESKNDSVPGPGSDLLNDVLTDEILYKFCCEKCKAIQLSHGNEPIAPRMISKGRFQVQLEGEGTYQCAVTGLVFEASEPVLVRYSVLSWSKFSYVLGDSWRFAGPIFNVDTVNKDASVLTSIQFPHSICISDPENETSFSVLHMKDSRPLIEPTVDHSGSHVKWNVTSLSPVGPIIPTSHAVERHGVVLVYWLSSNGNNNNNHNNKFHIYLAPNSLSEIQDIRKQVRGYRNRCVSIMKPPQCVLDEGTYRLLSEPEGEIRPQDLKFTFAVTQMKGFFEAFFEEPPPFKLSLIEVKTETTVWSTTIREEDCVIKTDKREERKRSNSRKRKSSTEEHGDPKRTRWQDESDAKKAERTWVQDMTEKQLLQLAKQLGKEWKQVGIFIDLTSKEVDDIKEAEPDVTMQKHKMLVTWKNRRQPGEATAYRLWQSVKNLDELSNEFHQTLQDMIDNPEAK
ncbi:uncharacterized protein AB9W97_007289 isoform 2-T2 [Spinachia spinachia]